MASTQKKSTNKKAKTQEKTSGPKKNASKAKTKPEPPVYQPNMLARGIGAGGCIFLAVMLGLGMFGVHAVVLDFLCVGIKGLVGYGFWVVAPALLLAAVLLLVKRKNPVRLRLWCLGLFPIFLGAFLHLLLSPYTYEIAFGTFSALWRDGGKSVQRRGPGRLPGCLLRYMVQCHWCGDYLCAADVTPAGRGLPRDPRCCVGPHAGKTGT